MESNKGYSMNQEEYIKFLEERLKHSDEQLEKAMEMLATLMSKMPKPVEITEDDIQEWIKVNKWS
jgi:hypothetical protein